MKKIASSSRCNRPYVFTFYHSSFNPEVDKTVAMTHCFYAPSLLYAIRNVRKLISLYSKLGCYYTFVLEDGLDSFDLDKAISRYDSQMKIPF